MKEYKWPYANESATYRPMKQRFWFLAAALPAVLQPLQLQRRENPLSWWKKALPSEAEAQGLVSTIGNPPVPIHALR